MKNRIEKKMNKAKVIVNGAFGKMGKVTCQTIENSQDYTLIASLGSNDNLSQTIQETETDIVIDFTTAEVAYEHAKIIIESNTHAVIGSSGLTPNQVQSLQSQCKEKQLGGIIAPNFSLGALLMMQCAALVAKHFNHVEIIETHHNQKIDAPSGTAVKTAEMINASRKSVPEDKTKPSLNNGSRGAICDDVHIHALRLPGFVASQQVVFGNLGENLSINHHSISRECFMPGVLLALKKVRELKHMVYGLETFIQ